MDSAAKRNLINELADKFRPAKLLSPIAQQLDDRTFLVVDFINYDSNEAIDTSVMGAQALGRVNDFLSLELGEIMLGYGYGYGIELNLYYLRNVVLSESVMDELVDLALEEVSESLIRERFAEQQAKFFTYMECTSADWGFE